MESKFKVGDKVVPVSKSVWGKSSLSMNEAKKLKQPFLYVTGFQEEYNAVICDSRQSKTGDFFLESDLIHYVEPKK